MKSNGKTPIDGTIISGDTSGTLGHSWEEYVTRGLEARLHKDIACWVLGDLAKDIVKSYGHDAIGKFAYAIGVDKKTLMNYRTVANFFSSEDIRTQYKKLSFSHFSTVIALKDPEVWLEEADNNDWSVEALRIKTQRRERALKPPVLTGTLPLVTVCATCKLYRLVDTSTYEICRGHYVTEEEGKMTYR